MIATGITDSARLDFLQGTHQEGDGFKIALYTAKAKLGSETTEYSPANEVDGKGYEQGGTFLAGYAISFEKGKAILTFSTPIWNDSSITARGAMIYNSSRGNKAIAVFDFGENITSTSDDFKVVIPPATAEEGLIRIS